MSNNIRPFTVAIDDADIDALRLRLAHTRWPEQETCTGWDQGMPLGYTRELAAYWAEGYDWRAREAWLNQFPQFLTEIDGLDIHFIHRRSPEPDALPLLVTHGWPGSVMEFLKVIDALADPAAHGGDAADAFHVVIPSLPGFGFSGKPTAAGTSVERIAGLWDTLMLRLGYPRYVAQGGDWGSIVTQAIALSGTPHCAGIHINLPIVSPDPETLAAPTPLEQRALAAMSHYADRDSGYSKIQSTRPQTLAYALADSPVGQMAWITDKYWSWTDCERDGVSHPEHAVTRDEILDQVSLYWFNNCAASSARLYWESFNNPDLSAITLPVGCSIYPAEIFQSSRRWAEQRYRNLVYWNELDAGGHFAALERPASFIEEVRNCFRGLRD